MRVYLTSKETDTLDYLTVSHIHQFQNLVLDKEASSIIVDNYLTLSSLNEIDKLLEIIMNKMRLGCKLTIIDHDIEALCLKYHRGEISTEEINSQIFETNVKSFVTCDTILSKIKSTAAKLNYHVEIEEGYIDLNSGIFTLKARRIK